MRYRGNYSDLVLPKDIGENHIVDNAQMEGDSDVK